MDKKIFFIDEDLANGILKYLADRPYKEVFPYIQGLQALKEYKQEKIEEKE